MSRPEDSLIRGQNYPKDGGLLLENTKDSVDLNLIDDSIHEPIDLDEFYEIFYEIAGAETETGDGIENVTFQENNEVLSNEILNSETNGCSNHAPISNEIMIHNNECLRENNSYLREFESFLDDYTKNMNKHIIDSKPDIIHKNKNNVDFALTKKLESRRVDLNPERTELELTATDNEDNDKPLKNADDRNLITLVNVDFTSINNFQDSLNATSKQFNENFTKSSASITITLSSDECSRLNFNDEEDIETISLISDIDEIEASVGDISDISMTNDNDDDYPEGYHSSDFEFITEDEAKQSSLTIKCTETHDKSNKTENTRIQTKEKAKSDSNKNSCQEFVDGNKANTSTAPKTMELDTKDKIEKYKYYRSIRREFELEQSKNARLAHVIPQGDDYLDLFRGIHAVADNAMEYKSVGLRPTKCMNVLIKEFEFGPGCDYKAPRIISDEERKYQQEAADNSKKILDLYPAENRKRKRRVFR